MKPRAYIIGNLSAKTLEERQENIRLADECARKLFDKGYAVIVPHKLMGNWYGAVEEAEAMECCLSLLETCSIAVICNPNWLKSAGSVKERQFADKNGIMTYGEESIVPPAVGYEPDTTERAIQLLLDRRMKGIKTYGYPLRPFNGRDSIQDAIEESADMLQYLLNYKQERLNTLPER